MWEQGTPPSDLLTSASTPQDAYTRLRNIGTTARPGAKLIHAAAWAPRFQVPLQVLGV